MRLTLWLFGAELLAVDIGPSEGGSSSLDGGTTLSDRIDPGPTDLTLGFTNGLEVGDGNADRSRPRRPGHGGAGGTSPP